MATGTEKIKRILIANRGEIAVRIIRTCREMGITAVVVFSDIDRNALHVQLADEAYSLGGPTATESYLNQTKILDRAVQAKVDAIHPGYGFLSENPSFAEAVARTGISFIGPTSLAMRQLGDKNAARKLARQCGILTVTGSDDSIDTVSSGLTCAQEIGFPIILKAAAGGGGKGMRSVTSSADFQSAFQMARSEAKNSFGDDRVYIEKYIENPRHIEIQILSDQHGNVVSLGERECSIQRRHQKVIEETPSPMMTSELRAQMSRAALKIVRAAQYSNACTVEFLVDQQGNYYFLEVNTRLQVEHPVTELVTGLDLVQQQILIAQGELLGFTQESIKYAGHALECRIYAEDPAEGFFPSTGKLTRYSLPQGPRIRIDNGFQIDDEISIYYDPLLAKLISWGKNRDEAIASMKRALSEFRIGGVKTTIPFCQFVLREKSFMKGDFNTQFVQQYFSPEKLMRDTERTTIAAVISAAAIKGLKKDSFTSMTAAKASETPWKHMREEFYR